MTQENIIKNADKIAAVLGWGNYEIIDWGASVEIINLEPKKKLFFDFSFDIILTYDFENECKIPLTVTQLKEMFKYI